jgi:hypothetical protein
MIDRFFNFLGVLALWAVTVAGIAVALVVCGAMLECGAQLIR